MRPLVHKIKPARGFSSLIHAALVAALPVAVYILVSIGFAPFAFAAVLFSKWRMFAVKPRFWIAILRANSVDIIVGLSTVVFMVQAESVGFRLLWTVLYAIWLLYLKPKSNLAMTSLQAFIAQLYGLTALYAAWPEGPLIGLVALTGGICYLTARHFFDSFDEPYSRMLSFMWAYFSAGLIWVLGHWMLYYGVIAQATVLLTTIGYGLAALYYFDHSGKLSMLLRRQFLFIMFAIIIVLITFSDWGDKVV